MKSNTQHSKSAGHALAAAVALAAMTLLAYLPVLRAGFIWDDDDYVTENLALRSLDGLKRIWFVPGTTHQFYPLVHTSFWVEYHLWRLNPLGYHVDNLLLHILNALLVWMVLRRLRLPFAWLAAAMFALHPVHVESVAWVTERKNLLSGAFYLLALLAWFKYDPPEQDAPPRRPAFYILALFLFVAALLSKTVTCTLPAAILILYGWKRGKLRLRDWLLTLPMFFLGALFGLGTAWMEKHYVGASGQDWHLSAVDRILLAGRALWFYAGSIVWPRDLMFIYPRWHIDSLVPWQYLFPIAALLVLALLRRYRAPLAATLFFAITLAPALGFVDVFPFRYSFVADHFQYLASLGMITLLAALIWRAGLRSAFLLRVAAGATLLCFGSLTFLQASVYRNAGVLWSDTLAKNPDCLIAHYNFANVLEKAGRSADAISHYSEAIRLKPDFFEAYSNRGSAFVEEGRIDEGIADFNRALAIDPHLPETQNNLGDALRRQGKFGDAINHFSEAVRLAPDFTLAHKSLGDTLLGQGKVEPAIAQYREVVRLLPDVAPAHVELARALLARHEWREGVREYAEASRLSPTPQIMDTLAWLLATAGDPAARDGSRALELAMACNRATGDREPAALDTLAAAYAEQGRFDEAAAMARRAMEALRNAGGKPDRIADSQARLLLYEGRKPFHQQP